MKKQIANTDELEFVIFCIESLAERLDIGGEEVYSVFDENELIDGYIVSNYEVMHTQGKDYIVNDLLDLLKKRGITI